MAILGISLMVLLVAALLFQQWHLARMAKRVEGTAVPPLPASIDAKLRERGKILLYFFSPHCGPCRSMTPRIDHLAERHDNVFKFDVSQNVDLARSLGVMATPTTLLIANGLIARVDLGALREERLTQLLA